MRSHIYYYTQLDTDFDVGCAALSGDPQGWLPAPAEPEPERDAWIVTLSADGALPGPVASMPAVVTVGRAAHLSERLLVPVRWQARAAARVFPVLEGDLELERLNAHGSKLSLTATYRPPLAVIGEFGDRLLGHQVAEACALRFVLDVAARVAVHASAGER